MYSYLERGIHRLAKNDKDVLQLKQGLAGTEPGALVYEIPPGDTLRLQIRRGAPIIINPTIERDILDIPTRGMEVAVFATAEKLLVKNRNLTNPPEQLLDIEFRRLRGRLGLTGSRALIPRLPEATALALMHAQATGLRLFTTSYSPPWMITSTQVPGLESYIAIFGNWTPGKSHQGGNWHVDMHSSSKPVHSTGVALFIAPSTIKP